MRDFFANILAPKNCKAERNEIKASQFAFVQKHVHKMLMKLTQGCNKFHLSCVMLKKLFDATA